MELTISVEAVLLAFALYFLTVYILGPPAEALGEMLRSWIERDNTSVPAWRVKNLYGWFENERKHYEALAEKGNSMRDWYRGKTDAYRDTADQLDTLLANVKREDTDDS